MLTYKLKANIASNKRNLEFDELFVSEDLSYISGVTEYTNDLSDGEEVTISSPYLNFAIKRPLHLELVRRQGYILTTEKINVKTVEGVGDDYNKVRYVEYNGNYYYEFNNNDLDGFFINGRYYKMNYDNTISVESKHWIENGYVFIKGEKYFVDLNLIPNITGVGYKQPKVRKVGNDKVLLTIDGKPIKVIDYEYNKWKTVFKFIIKANTNNEILVDKAKSVVYEPSISYSGVTYGFKTETSSDETISYGVTINNTFYPVSGISSLDEFIDNLDSTIEIDGSIINIDFDLKTIDEGKLLLLNLENGDSSLEVGDSLIALSNDNVGYLNISSYVDEGGTPIEYIDYLSKRYLVENHLEDYTIINGKKYVITYINSEKTLGTIILNGKLVDVIVKDKKCYFRNKIYAKTDFGVDYIPQSASTLDNFYEVEEVSGVTLGDGVKCPIIFINDENDNEIKVCRINEPIKYELFISSIVGDRTLICKQVNLSGDEAKTANRDISENFLTFKFSLKNDVFGNNDGTLFTGALKALNADHPISSKDVVDLQSELKIQKIVDYSIIPLPLGNKIDPAVDKEDRIISSVMNDVLKNNVNGVVDMEKDVYYPSYKTVDSNNQPVFNPITEIQFNLHFRTRDLDSWKVNEDNSTEIGTVKNIKAPKIKWNGQSFVSEEGSKSDYTITYSNNSDETNWFITDFIDYKNILNDTTSLNTLQMESDLLGFLGFTNDDVKYRKKKISKSFLRLSFYSTPNPQNQVLLSTSTIFMDENNLFKTFIDNSTNQTTNYKYITLNGSGTTNNGIGVFAEQYDNETKSLLFNENRRLSSKITVKDKYNASHSSEGFYMYMFREYSSNLRENTVYLKIDFCHAGNGLVIPMTMPISSIDGRGPLYLDNFSDISELKEGVPLNKLNDNLYIPIKLVYSEKDKKYFYYLPNNMVENFRLGVEDENIMLFNLFELKIKNQSYETFD